MDNLHLLSCRRKYYCELSYSNLLPEDFKIYDLRCGKLDDAAFKTLTSNWKLSMQKKLWEINCRISYFKLISNYSFSAKVK